MPAELWIPAVHFGMSCFIGAVSFSLTGMAPVIGCRRRPILGAWRTSYKFRDEGFRWSCSSGTLVNIPGRGERRRCCPKWTVHFSARPFCALRATNHPSLTLRRRPDDTIRTLPSASTKIALHTTEKTL
ncbi:hypothetical protein TcasGA2_TC014307 [Tribolium castaneum]|uniref:Uncharacterized protein n=1 Tax=Tribolium castaneum TaxID=7070 RepID=D6WL72_TRICA|nr:hypothetical protein TcasGA2_TC014307 [Tribolium castaneum]